MWLIPQGFSFVPTHNGGGLPCLGAWLADSWYAQTPVVGHWQGVEEHSPWLRAWPSLGPTLFVIGLHATPREFCPWQLSWPWPSVGQISPCSCGSDRQGLLGRRGTHRSEDSIFAEKGWLSFAPRTFGGSWGALPASFRLWLLAAFCCCKNMIKAL